MRLRLYSNIFPTPLLKPLMTPTSPTWRTHLLMPTHATSSACMSSRLGDVPVVGRMIGPSAPSLILGRRRAAGTHASTTTPVLLAPTSARVNARGAIHASSLMGFLSAGCIRPVTAHSHARMGLHAGGGCVSLRTPPSNCVCCLRRRARGVWVQVFATNLSRMTGHLRGASMCLICTCLSV